MKKEYAFLVGLCAGTIGTIGFGELFAHLTRPQPRSIVIAETVRIGNHSVLLPAGWRTASSNNTLLIESVDKPNCKLTLRIISKTSPLLAGNKEILKVASILNENESGLRYGENLYGHTMYYSEKYATETSNRFVIVADGEFILGEGRWDLTPLGKQLAREIAQIQFWFGPKDGGHSTGGPNTRVISVAPIPAHG